jgi:transcriptional regulator with PAS, ATPase and Fis domain
MTDVKHIDHTKFQTEHGIIGTSVEMQEIINTILQVAPTDITVLVTGESGVGKEIIAKAIHAASKRANKALVTVNCGAIPEGIIESELFGHEKGAFTGATDQRKGYFELADGGTIFLDEIGELPLATQVKFLRVLENGEFMRVGSSQTREVDVRIIAATNHNLEQSVRTKTFRSDLFFRLRTVNIQIPPLREHREDIPILAAAFVGEFCERNTMPVSELDDEVISVLMNYNWPGNVRELRNVVESLLVMHAGGAIRADDVRKLLRGYSLNQSDDRNLPVVMNKTAEQAERELIYRALVDMKSDIIEMKNLLSRSMSADGIPISSAYEGSAVEATGHRDDGESLTLDEMERKMIASALDKYLGNRRRAARALKISERTLYRKIKEYGLQG